MKAVKIWYLLNYYFLNPGITNIWKLLLEKLQLEDLLIFLMFVCYFNSDTCKEIHESKSEYRCAVACLYTKCYLFMVSEMGLKNNCLKNWETVSVTTFTSNILWLRLKINVYFIIKRSVQILKWCVTPKRNFCLDVLSV